ncbi:hypothetical protein SLA2020_288620 [Shorea laevis]
MERMEKKIEMLYEKKYGIPYPQHSQTVSTPFPQSNLTVTQKPKDTKAQPPLISACYELGQPSEIATPPSFATPTTDVSSKATCHIIVTVSINLHANDQTKAPPPQPQIALFCHRSPSSPPSQPCLHPIRQCRRLRCLTPDRGSPK